MTKPRLGTLLLASAWMRDVGLDTQGGGLARRIQETAQSIVARLSEACEPVFPGVPASAEEAARAAESIAKAGCDAVLVAPLVWCEDQIVRAATSRLGTEALILATLVPHGGLPPVARFGEMLAGSGTVGALQASGLFAREGRRASTVCGRVDDPAVYREIGAHVRAAAAERRIRGSRIGLLPWRCEAMSVTWVDEVALRTAHGVELVPLDIGRLAKLAAEAKLTELEALRRRLGNLGVEIRTDQASLEQGMRVALAVAALADQEKLCGLAMNDLAPEMHKALGLRPCLPEPDLAGSGFVVGMEADVAATLTMRALALFTGSPPFYTEVFTLDLATNCMLMGHAGWHSLACRDPAVAVQLIPDEEYRAVDQFAGAAIYFPYPAGPVTAVNAVYRTGGLCWTVVEGESLGGVHLEGNCHLLCRIEEPLPVFIRRSTARGVSQHWAVLSGHVEADVRLLADRMGVRVER